MSGTNVFVYGTLQYPEVLRALIGRVPDQEPATLSGYTRFCVKNQVFPAIVSAGEADQVPGILLRNLNPHEMQILDSFEGEEYVKTAGAVTPLDNGGVSQSALYYVWHPSLYDQLNFEDWDMEYFRERHLANYEHMCLQFAKEAFKWKAGTWA